MLKVVKTERTTPAKIQEALEKALDKDSLNVKHVLGFAGDEDFIETLSSADEKEVKDFVKLVILVNKSNWVDLKSKTKKQEQLDLLNNTVAAYNLLVVQINRTDGLYAKYLKDKSSAFQIKFGDDDDAAGYSPDTLMNRLKEDESGKYGHEVSDLINDNGKKGKVYYDKAGSPLKAIGSNDLCHASSRSGHTLFWEKNGDVYTILAIGKHADNVPSRLSEAASYEIIHAYDSTFKAYEGKIVGFEV